MPASAMQAGGARTPRLPDGSMASSNDGGAAGRVLRAVRRIVVAGFLGGFVAAHAQTTVPAQGLDGDHADTSAASAPLTAGFEGMPATHDGRAFTFEVRFSEEVGVGHEAMRTSAFGVTGATIGGVRRLSPPSNARWEIKVAPAGAADIVISLPAERACGTTGAICTSAGKRFSAAVSATVSARFNSATWTNFRRRGTRW